MNQQQVEMMRHSYSLMNDEDLIRIFATRASTLTDEARFALHEAIHLRRIENFDAEVRATHEDLAQQIESEKVKIEKHAEAQRAGRKFLYVFSGMLIVGGLFISIFHDVEKGLAVAVAGIGAIVVSVIRRLVGRFVVALFRN